MTPDNWLFFLPCCKYFLTSFQFDRNHFWVNLLKNEKRNTFKTFIRGKDFVLREDQYHSSVLTIGLDPENRFKVTASLQVLRSGSIILSDNELRCLLEADYENVGYISFDEGIFHIFEIEISGKKVCIDEKSLEALLRMQIYIERYTSLLEVEATLYERSFFKLLEHFYRGKSIQETLEMSETEYLHCFFSEILETECLDIDQEFILDLATKFEKFFVKSLPYFIKTLMLIESERIQTFSKYWPHSKEYISTKNMAMSGLYFTGIEDSVMCAFCPVMIYQWMSGDDPVADHYKFYKHCRFLWDPKRTLNVLDVSSESDLKKLLSHLPKRGIDEID